MKLILFFLLLSLSMLGQDQQTYILSYDVEKKDTLFIHSDRENIQYHFIWKGDTLLSEWTYEPLVNACSPLGAMGFYNSFLVSAHSGDGCPVLYRIMALNHDGTWFVSDLFGNCETFTNIKLEGYSKMTFTFDASMIAKRKKVKVTYNAEKYKIE